MLHCIADLGQIHQAREAILTQDHFQLNDVDLWIQFLTGPVIIVKTIFQHIQSSLCMFHDLLLVLSRL
ncbi:hypothetical protein D3C72_1358370 [compost metagenome]